MSGFLENLKKIFTEPAGGSSSRLITFIVKCDRCGEEIKTRASKTSDISRVYEEEGAEGAEYFLRKEILGSKCNNLIYITIYFGPGFNIVSQEITGGKFV